MQLITSPIFQPRSSPKEAVPYSSAALRQDLERLRGVWDDCQANRDRDAIYGYLNGVYGLVAWWAAEGREIERARRALRLQRLKVSDREDPFASVIRCTANPAKADKRTRSKWSRVMRYAVAYTRRVPSPWSSSSAGRAGSMNALLGSLGGWGVVAQPGAGFSSVADYDHRGGESDSRHRTGPSIAQPHFHDYATGTIGRTYRHAESERRK
jgi:hypothetical protein